MKSKQIFLLQIFSFGLVAVMLGCGLYDPDEHPPGKTVPLNPKLKRVLYIGNVDPKNTLPNQGQPFGHVQLSVWISPYRLYVYTGEVKNEVVRRGLFEIEIDENTKAFKSYAVFEFPYYIRSAGFDRSTNKVFIIYADRTQTKAAYVSFSNNYTIIDEELVGAEWSPWGMAAWEGKPGIIFYGENPGNGKKGFYWRYHHGQSSVKDSLLYAIALDQFSAAEFSTSNDGHYLFFGMNVGSQDDRRAQFLKLDITRPAQNPVVIAERRGGYLAIRANPVDTQLALLNYVFGGDEVNPPQAHLELLNVTTLRGVDLDVRTLSSLSWFILNQDPFWSPDGKHFAFCAGGATGEAAKYPLELWVYENVP
jgi:hypothetical protein